MAVPEDIRAVPRPTNTVVCYRGGNGPKRYAVRERRCVKYVRGGNPRPYNGKIVGHIIDHKFVPVTESKPEPEAAPVPETPREAPDAERQDAAQTAAQATAAPEIPDSLSFGGAALVKSVSEDLFEDLLATFPVNEAFSLISMSSLKVVKPGVTLGRMAAHYKRTFVSAHYPGAAMSKNTLGKLLETIGMYGSRRRAFFERRLARVAADHHIAIDSTLKQNTSKVNDLSAYSYKAKTRGVQDISVMFAYDLERMEPVCAQVFPGNYIDASCYPEFIRDNDIRRGVIVADKGFPPSKIKAELNERPDLHFLTPIKRNDVRIADNDMLEFEGVLAGVENEVLYKKKRIKGGRFLYAYKDSRAAAQEDAQYLAKSKAKGAFDYAKYEAKRKVFGVIVLESDLDMEPLAAYRCYADRWRIELVFKYYKSDEFLDRTNVQGDFSVIGNEFVNYISTVMTCRIIHKAQQCGLLEKLTYGELMDDLCGAWRRADAPIPARSDDSYWVHATKIEKGEMEALGLSIPAPRPEPKKRGRKPKPKEEPAAAPKRRRGRPRKTEIPPSDAV